MKNYFSLTLSVVKPLEDKIDHNCLRSKQTNAFKEEVLARVGNFLLIPTSFMSSVTDTTIGLGASLATIMSGGIHKPTGRFAKKHTYSSIFIFSKPFRHLLKTLNPEAFRSKLTSYSFKEIPYVSENGDGIITTFVLKKLMNAGHYFSECESFFERHIVSRITYAITAIASVITRIADGIIGILAASISLITFGKIETINNIAYRGLQVPGVIFDLTYCAVKIINPQS